jgi:hypothetical protein
MRVLTLEEQLLVAGGKGKGKGKGKGGKGKGGSGKGKREKGRKAEEGSVLRIWPVMLGELL